MSTTSNTCQWCKTLNTATTTTALPLVGGTWTSCDDRRTCDDRRMLAEYLEAEQAEQEDLLEWNREMAQQEAEDAASAARVAAYHAALPLLY